MEEEDRNYLLVNKWVYLMVSMFRFKGESINLISQRLQMTYSHTIKIVRAIEQKGWMTFKKEGRSLSYDFTQQGIKVLSNCMETLELVEGKDFWLLKKDEQVKTNEKNP